MNDTVFGDSKALFDCVFDIFKCFLLRVEFTALYTDDRLVCKSEKDRRPDKNKTQ